jgi:flagellar export protein FliJ
VKPFRLQTVERLRGQALETRAQELHAAGRARDEAVAERDRLVALLAGGVGLSTSGLWSGAELDLANNYRLVLRQQIQDEEDRIALALEKVATAREAWTTARGELHAVQALHESHRRAVAAERARIDQRELDEHAGNMHSSLRRPARGEDDHPDARQRTDVHESDFYGDRPVAAR